MRENLMYDLVCPYCNKTVDLDYFGGEGTATDVHHRKECPHCAKSFVFLTWIEMHHDSKKADCLNGAPHSMRAVKHSSYYPNWRQCRTCGTEDIGKRLEPSDEQ